MFLIRQAGPADFSGVFPLARILDSYNLPADGGYIRELLVTSQLSFQGRLPREKARYLFVIEKRGLPPKGTVPKIVGCSLILAKHGVKGSPHLWFELRTVTKRSRTLGLTRRQPILQLGFTENGPTEVGGLVLLPGFRRHPLACGMQISFVRFLYMAVHPERFSPSILVEYRGALGKGGTSIFWERVGRLFTGLSYRKADRLSVLNKEFIVSLLPKEPIYCALLPRELKAAIGAIHPSAQRAAWLLESIGFRPIPQIEPFDGGPYYLARRDEIRIVRTTRRARCRVDSAPEATARSAAAHSVGWYLVGTEAGGFFRAAVLLGRWIGRRWATDEDSMRILGLQENDPVYVTPIRR